MKQLFSPQFHSRKHGAALAIRIIPFADTTSVSNVLQDGSIAIRISAPPYHINKNLLVYLSGLLDIPQKDLEIVAGHTKTKKLVSIAGMSPAKVQGIILANLSRNS